MYIKRGFLFILVALTPHTHIFAQEERTIITSETVCENCEAIDITNLDNRELVLTRSGQTSASSQC